MPVAVKRIYDDPSPRDGTRVLVDRLWPRGLSKERAAIHAWFRQLAPSDALRQWFHSQTGAWPVFRKYYLKELAKPEASPALEELHNLAHQRKKLTLLFGARDEEHNNAVILKELLDGMRKPPAGTGPAAIRSLRGRQARRMPR